MLRISSGSSSHEPACFSVERTKYLMLSKSISLRSAPHVGIGLRSNSCRPFRRFFSIHSGSFLRVEMPRTTASLSPRWAAAPAASASCQPNSYCPRLASSGRSISTSDIVTLSSGPQRCHPPRHSCSSGGVPKRDAARWAQSSGAVLRAYTVSDAERDAPASDPLILQGSAAAPGGRALLRPRPERIPRRQRPDGRGPHDHRPSRPAARGRLLEQWLPDARGPPRHRRGVGDARRADRDRRHRRTGAADRIGTRMPDLAAAAPPSRSSRRRRWASTASSSSATAC